MAERCTSSAAYGDYVCSLPAGHDWLHECRRFGAPGGSLWASWEDADADPEDYECAHTEMEWLNDALLSCTRCVLVFREIEDDVNGTTWVDWLEEGAWNRKKVRYEVVAP